MSTGGFEQMNGHPVQLYNVVQSYLSVTSYKF